MMKRAFIALAAIGSALTATVAVTPALAEEATSQSVSIKYEDLDLTSNKGQKLLAKRIDNAAREICGIGKVRTGTRLPSSRDTQCYKEARAKASAQFAELIGGQSLGG